MGRFFAANRIESTFNPFHFGHFNAKSGTIIGNRIQENAEIWNIRPDPASHRVSILRRCSPGERAFPSRFRLGRQASKKAKWPKDPLGLSAIFQVFVLRLDQSA